MENKKLGQEPIFPMFNSEGMPTYFNNNPNFGIDKRFYAACAAMQGILANSSDEMLRLTNEQVVDLAYDTADALLKQENE